MNSLFNEITQISIYLREEEERINEVSLFQPFSRTSHFDEKSKPILSRRWSYHSSSSLYQNILLKCQKFIFKHFHYCIPSKRVTAEAKFKTIVALLLVQEEMRDFFLKDPQRRKIFFHALTEAAQALDYSLDLSLLTLDTPLAISRELTKLNAYKMSLIEDPVQLSLQLATLKPQERSELLYRILNHLERPPIHSVIEVIHSEKILSFPLTTQYAKYKILYEEPSAGKFLYRYQENHATSSICTQRNLLPNAKGTMNQRSVYATETMEWVGSYCGELSTSFRVLEQLLLILKQTQGEAERLTSPPLGTSIEKKKILFSSLYSWNEFGLITNQKAAIEAWNHKILKCRENHYHLQLYYYNVSFNAWNKYPIPSEIKARIQDMNDLTLIHLLKEGSNLAGLNFDLLNDLVSQLLNLQALDSLHTQSNQLDVIDTFRSLKPLFVEQIRSLQPTTLTHCLTALITEKQPDGLPLKGVNKLIYLEYLCSQLGYLHNKNCNNATDRTAAADAVDKAQHVFKKIYDHHFLPGLEEKEEKEFFKVLYSMYLVWEEPEITTWMSTGFLGEKFYGNFLQKNPEATHYLVSWLQKHPEFYLGLSGHRM